MRRGGGTDTDVDVADLLNVLSSFGVDGGADTDGNGDTDIVDLLNVLSQFGSVCASDATNDCDGNDWDFHMTDTYGNGWDCAYATISDCDGNVLAAELSLGAAAGESCDSWTIHDAGTAAVGDVCLAASDGYTVAFTSGFYDGEIGWTLIDSDGSIALSGGAPGTVTTCGAEACD